MEALLIVFGVIIIFLISYIVYLQHQLRSISNQLNKRRLEKTRQPISIELINSELNKLVANINKCLKDEEILRLNDTKKENQFKEMIANISHDLRTPLTAIKGYQQLLLKGELSEEQTRKLEIAQKHADELGILIENFFEYSYVLNIEAKPKLESINITNLVEQCIVESIEVLEDKNLVVHFNPQQAIFVLGDKKMLTRVIQNLIRNCSIHSAGDIEVKVIENEQGIISFKNPMKHSSKIDVKRLFERFYTGDKARGKTTGLGLSIVKLLVEQMNGKVRGIIKENYLEIQVQIPLNKK
ncbi:HAMP domain-containing sensor histidine kinase [Clostridium intestinale]|uniref:sensor histidine kinase n=1 Tax=Clostridium intestinale TaxID=36845 RepID=UPI002DD6B0C2|nr:HAMP domain-containing sensor histidine kinase [Clostridium intestinale]WRY52183.1 HAMP domain-containing sensor histidine kinase [Clostridium intestinale]